VIATRQQIEKILDDVPASEGVLIVDGSDRNLRKLAERPSVPGRPCRMVVLGGPDHGRPGHFRKRPPKKKLRAQPGHPLPATPTPTPPSEHTVPPPRSVRKTSSAAPTDYPIPPAHRPAVSVPGVTPEPVEAPEPELTDTTGAQDPISQFMAGGAS
jgi:hypothetical protein